MKKIYSLTLALVVLISAASAQSICGPTPPRASTTVWVGFCVVSATGLPANTQVKIFVSQAGAEILPLSGQPIFTDATGSVEITYDCSTGIANWLEACNPTGCCSAPVIDRGSLPVKLTSFTGRLANDNEVTLDWASSIEFKNSKYEVERSQDGKNYVKVGVLEGAGTSTAAIKYTFSDKLPSSGAYFYRLKQVDFDHTSEFSKVVYVNSKKGTGIVTKIFPNPFKGEVQLIGATSADLQPKNLAVFNITGQRVPYRVTGANSILIDPASNSGQYIIKMINTGATFKLVKSESASTY